jgi:hypothetical protein
VPSCSVAVEVASSERKSVNLVAEPTVEVDEAKNKQHRLC